MSTFTVFGATFDSELYFCRHIVNRIVGKNDNTILDFDPMLEIDFITRLNELRSTKGGGYYRHSSSHCVIRDGEYLGDIVNLIDIATNEYGIDDVEIANTHIFEAAAKEDTDRAVKQTSHPAVYLQLGTDKFEKESEPLGTVVIELYDDLCPKACENFILLCTGEIGRIPLPQDKNTSVTLHYEGTPVHRVVPGGWVQCGDVVDGSGEYSISAFGEPFEDESFSVDFGTKIGGILGYVNKAPHSNGSQFFITLGPCEW
eukprot:CAMPEP_0182428188 /NCGR_PEP_ID=MMETSP1167-20130531/21319_1 /TAXON_ID=2988 /ORGANISM="Mallomonas Sp, Strain CCMP3275" /LENGTH=257 /DNA_ID=CAMNT_0024610923 /DNA_START=171 /DNA_END=941 /DNA_ORIENTATION=+